MNPGQRIPDIKKGCITWTNATTLSFANMPPSDTATNLSTKSSNTCNTYQLKWRQPRVIYSWHTTLQEKLLDNLKQKLLWKVVDADLGHWPCNFPSRFKINGECAYGWDASCRTSGMVYKILCKANTTCNCFYIGKSQHYIKMRAQDYIREVMKL